MKVISIMGGAALLAIGACATAAVAQEETAAAAPPAAAPAPPSCDADEYRQFDFWLGTWNVTGPNGQQAGVNEITSEENGCLLVERWKGAGGGTGQSYNFYDPGLQKWRQVWVALGATIDYSGGLTETGSMKLTGEIAYRNSGLIAPFTGEWTLNEDGTVTQHFEQQNAETGEWQPWFTGVYTRAESEPDE